MHDVREVLAREELVQRPRRRDVGLDQGEIVAADVLSQVGALDGRVIKIVEVIDDDNAVASLAD